ncbi:hypothetical protein [Pseudopedobacter beijingensis]|uniref:Uncharacterized protein n=1 Tax=Pseudopedobacter beijingensis TaxID=1207056 RepID=A0ABW4I7L6_9SPHI
MKKLKILFTVFLLSAGFSLIAFDAHAQCAMCQSTVESNVMEGGSTAKKLNSGIMYLLAAPYLVVAGIGFLWYKKYRKKDIVIDIKNEKINLN